MVTPKLAPSKLSPLRVTLPPQIIPNAAPQSGEVLFKEQLEKGAGAKSGTAGLAGVVIGHYRVGDSAGSSPSSGDEGKNIIAVLSGGDVKGFSAEKGNEGLVEYIR